MRSVAKVVVWWNRVTKQRVRRPSMLFLYTWQNIVLCLRKQYYYLFVFNKDFRWFICYSSKLVKRMEQSWRIGIYQNDANSTNLNLFIMCKVETMFSYSKSQWYNRSLIPTLRSLKTHISIFTCLWLYLHVTILYIALFIQRREFLQRTIAVLDLLRVLIYRFVRVAKKVVAESYRSDWSIGGLIYRFVYQAIKFVTESYRSAWSNKRLIISRSMKSCNLNNVKIEDNRSTIVLSDIHSYFSVVI